MTPRTEHAKENLCKVLFKIGALRFGTFKLTSGKMSPYYIDLRVVPSFPDAFEQVCNFYLEMVREHVGTNSFTRIAGIPISGLPFAAVVARELRKPLLFPRDVQKGHGRERRVEGVLNPGDTVLIIDDLVTSAKSIMKAVESIRMEGGVVNDAVVLIDREEGGKERLGESGIRLHYLLKASEAANTLHQVGAITDSELTTILKQSKRKG
ncbi:MAG: orotate phosphoribosyltransferase [Candidatus Bathyarchaeota archaeon]|nr:MAG: orotate phosphoribosyltransferase [Candidatus Bathyarchaeota archaeon]